jgi:dUTP pyrophosphatase
MSSWAAGWVFTRGLEIEFDDRFLDVAVKISTLLGGRIRHKKRGFVLLVPEYPERFDIDFSFLRGVFEAGGVWGSGSLFIPKLADFGREMQSALKGFSPLVTEEGFFVVGEKAQLLIHTFYDEETEERSEFFFEKFLSVLAGQKWDRKFFRFSVEDGAIPPFKKRISDSGWDLHLVKLVERDGNLFLFDTGVRVSPPPGFYFDLVPRSSIYKSGFVLANSVGIIDMTYRGTIKVPLIKVDPLKPEPELPWRAVQLIPRRFYPVEALNSKSLDETIRGEGGFGSTG